MRNNAITMRYEVDGHEPFFVRDTGHSLFQPRPHGWRATSSGIALVGCEPAAPDVIGAHELDWESNDATRAAGKMWMGSIRDIIVLLEGCRRYRWSNRGAIAPEELGDATEYVAKFERTAGPYHVDARFFGHGPTRYRVHCGGCGANSKWYLEASRRYLMSFHSKHECAR